MPSSHYLNRRIEASSLLIGVSRKHEPCKHFVWQVIKAPRRPIFNSRRVSAPGDECQMGRTFVNPTPRKMSGTDAVMSLPLLWISFVACFHLCGASGNIFLLIGCDDRWLQTSGLDNHGWGAIWEHIVVWQRAACDKRDISYNCCRKIHLLKQTSFSKRAKRKFQLQI